MMPRGVSILGSTGSIGCNTLRVIAALGADQFRVVALGAGSNAERLAEQIDQFKPELVSVNSDDTAEKLQRELRNRGVSAPAIHVGEQGLIEVATHERADSV